MSLSFEITSWTFELAFYEIFVLFLIIGIACSIIKYRKKKEFIRSLYYLALILPIIFNFILVPFLTLNIIIMLFYIFIISWGSLVTFSMVYMFHAIEFNKGYIFSETNKGDSRIFRFKRIIKVILIISGLILEIYIMAFLITANKIDNFEEFKLTFMYELFFLPLLIHIPSFSLIISFMTGILVEDSIKINKENGRYGKLFQIIAMIILIFTILTLSITFQISEFLFGFIMILQILLYSQFYLKKKEVSKYLKIFFIAFVSYGIISFYIMSYTDPMLSFFLIVFPNIALFFITFPFATDKQYIHGDFIKQFLACLFFAYMSIFQVYMRNFEILYEFHPLFSFEIYLFFLLGVIINFLYNLREKKYHLSSKGKTV